jgi:hypothetical protein
LWNWFPTIWNDRNWDHHYIYVILKRKLELQENFIRNHGHHLNAEKDADRMKICILLLDRLIEDNYIIDATKPHDKKWGEGKFNFEPCEDEPELSKLNIIYENVKNAEDEKQQKKEYKIAAERANNSRQNDLNHLFKIMNKYIEGWWD